MRDDVGNSSFTRLKDGGERGREGRQGVRLGNIVLTKRQGVSSTGSVLQNHPEASQAQRAHGDHPYRGTDSGFVAN